MGPCYIPVYVELPVAVNLAQNHRQSHLLWHLTQVLDNTDLQIALRARVSNEEMRMMAAIPRDMLSPFRPIRRPRSPRVPPLMTCPAVMITRLEESAG
jgi:hypothetical protein